MTTTKQILVIGGAGYIGSACVARLSAEGHRVTVFDNLSSGKRDAVSEDAAFIEGDIRDAQALDTAFAQSVPNVVIHLAAGKSVEEGEHNPEKYFSINVVGTINVLEAVAKHDVPHLIFSSTAAVYQPHATGVYSEEDAMEPLSVYGTTKLIAEMLINECVRTQKLTTATIFRYFNVAGDAGLRFKEEKAANLFPLIAQAVREGRGATVFGDDYETTDGTGVRDYIHINDIVEAHVHSINEPLHGTFNLGMNQGHSVLEVIKAFAAALGYDVPYVVQPRRAGDAGTAIADVEKMHTASAWRATHTLADMVTSTLETYGAKN